MGFPQPTPPPLFSGVIFVLLEAAGSRVCVTQLESLWILRAENMGKILLEELLKKNYFLDRSKYQKETVPAPQMAGL